MADVTWTQEQLAAITARNPGILVSAGAGSGKTAVLTERVVQRIFDPVDPVDADRMLIVTFTRAAAEEMRERIAVKLRAVQREHPEDSSVARQLILLEKADISTVHAFCQRIVKENFQLLDIQSGFRIADEKELEVWRTEAAGEILEEEYAAGEGSFLSLVELLSEERSDRRVTDTLLRLYDFVRAHPFYEAWLEQALERYRSEAPIGGTDWGKLLIADALSGARQALEAMEEARDLLDGDEKIGVLVDLTGHDGLLLVAAGHAPGNGDGSLARADIVLLNEPDSILPDGLSFQKASGRDKLGLEIPLEHHVVL